MELTAHTLPALPPSFHPLFLVAVERLARVLDRLTKRGVLELIGAGSKGRYRLLPSRMQKRKQIVDP